MRLRGAPRGSVGKAVLAGPHGLIYERGFSANSRGRKLSRYLSLYGRKTSAKKGILSEYPRGGGHTLRGGAAVLQEKKRLQRGLRRNGQT